MSADITVRGCWTTKPITHYTARGESIRGHTRVRDTLHAGSSVNDPCAARVVDDPTLQSADILTAAVDPTELVAVDVGVCAPRAVSAGLDCTENMKQQKTHTNEPFLHELVAQRVRYVPVAMNCYGSRHADTTKACCVFLAPIFPDKRRIIGRVCVTQFVRHWRASPQFHSVHSSARMLPWHSYSKRPI